MRNLERYEKDYSTQGFEYFHIKYRKKMLYSILNRYQPKRILEIGCGLDPLYKYIDWNYEKYVVVEPIEGFYKKALSKDKRVVCINDYFYASDYLKSLEFDFIICSCLLHEVEDPNIMIQDIKSICNESTIVHINVPNAKSIHRLVALEMGLIDDVHDFSERNITLQQHVVFDLQSLTEIAERNELDIIDSGSYFIKPFSSAQMYELIDNDIIDVKVLDGLFGLGKYLPLYGSEIYINCVRKKESF